MTCLLNLEVMHSLKGYVPVTYSTRLTFIHAKTVLVTIIPAKKTSPVNYSQSLQIPAVLQMDTASSSPPSPGMELSHHSINQQLISGCVNF